MKKSQLLERRRNRRRAAIRDQPFAPPYRRLSKAALSGPSVCLRTRAPCPLRVSCLRIARERTALVFPAGSLDHAKRAAKLQALAFWWLLGIRQVLLFLGLSSLEPSMCTMCFVDFSNLLGLTMWLGEKGSWEAFQVYGVW